MRRVSMRRFWLLFVQARSRLDLYRVGLHGRYKYYASWIGFATGIFGLLVTPWEPSTGSLLAVVGLSISAGLLIPEWVALRYGKVAVEHIAHQDYSGVKVDMGRVIHHPGISGEVVVVDEDIDAALSGTWATCSWRSHRTSVSDKVRRHTYEILRERIAVKTVYNGRIVRQDTDLTASLLRSGGDVQLSMTDYYTLICTNYMVDWRVIERSTLHEVMNGLELIVNSAWMLQPLETNRLANAIGVSSLAFTSDLHLALTRQHRQAQSSGGLYAPAGSGSMDLRDVLGIRRSHRSELATIVKTAMRRELLEECHLSGAEVGRTELLGYFRWINMGAKPEYTGVTMLNISSDALRSRQVRLSEVNYVKFIDVDCRLDLSMLRDDPDGLSCLPERYRYEISTPLFMSLRALGVTLQGNDQRSQQLNSALGLK